jgi:hypothetical protein
LSRELAKDLVRTAYCGGVVGHNSQLLMRVRICDSVDFIFGGSRYMKTFLVALFAAVVAAVISGVVLSNMNTPVGEAFSQPSSVRLGA